MAFAHLFPHLWIKAITVINHKEMNISSNTTTLNSDTWNVLIYHFCILILVSNIFFLRFAVKCEILSVNRFISGK